jgi:hypothetical protein
MRALVVACAAALAVVASAAARPQTTNEPAIFTVKGTLTDRSVSLRPARAARGSIVTFIITNRGRKTHRFVLGDVKRGPGYGEGFARTLKPNQQATLVMYLNYRGTLRYLNRLGPTTVARGVFRIT